MDPLQTFASGDTDYISKHNANSSAIVSAVTAVETGKQDASAKGQPNGYAGLDGAGKVPVGTLPDMTLYEVKVAKGANSGYCELDSTGHVPAARLPTSDGAGTQPFYVPFFYLGIPANLALMSKIVLPAGVTFPAALAGSLGNVGTTPTASTALAVGFYRAGVVQQTGTITISTGGVFTFATSAAFISQAGDVLKVTNQATADATCADISATLVGTR